MTGSALLLAVALAAPPQQLPTGLEPALHAGLAVFVVAEAADYALTQYALSTGRVHEANPAMYWSADSPAQMALVKGAVTVGVTYAMLKLHRRHPKLTVAATWIAAGVVMGAALHNAHALRR